MKKSLIILILTSCLCLAEFDTKKLNADSFKDRQAAQKELDAWVKSSKKEEVNNFFVKNYDHNFPEVRFRVRSTLREYLKREYLEGFLGVRFTPIVLNDKMVISVDLVLQDSPASRANFQLGDIIIEVDGKGFNSKNTFDGIMEFSEAIKKLKPFSMVKFKILSGNQIVEKTAIVGFVNPEKDFVKKWVEQQKRP